uniref:Caspase-3 n=1 Tax=Laticauda laticaudata TaxID=8630 RepID=A0A8C5SYC2_LATLA
MALARDQEVFRQEDSSFFSLFLSIAYKIIDRGCKTGGPWARCVMRKPRPSQLCKGRKRGESRAEHGKCFVSILSSHGEDGCIMDCQGQALKLTRIYNILSSERCPHLAGKPKIFFIQACRGNRFDDGIYLETDSAPEEDCFSHYLSIPESTAVMFSCSPGYVSFSNQWESMFLKALLEVLEGEERKLKVNKLMTWINWKVAFLCEAKGTVYKGKKEMPCFVTNMVEKVYPFKQDRECSDYPDHSNPTNTIQSSVHDAI